MRDDQITARLRVLNKDLARLFELARISQRKPSRQEALLTTEVAQTFGNGLVLRGSMFSRSRRVELPYVPDAVRDLALTVFGEGCVSVETVTDTPDADEFRLTLALTNLDPVRYANTVHELTVFLTGLAKIDSSTLHGYWALQNPEQAERDRQRFRNYFATALGIVGGYQNMLGRF